MPNLEEKKIIIRLPTLKWRSFLTIRFLLVLVALLFSSFFAYWYHNVRPFIWISCAHVEAHSTVLSSDMQGRIAEMGPEEGDFVKKGQTLFSLDRDLTLAKHAQAKFTLDSLNHQIEQEKGRIGKAMEAYLTASNELDLGLGSPDVVKKQLSMMDEAQEKSEAALSKVANAKSELEMISLQLKKMTAVAPFDGVVLKRSKNPGAVVTFGDPVYTICNPNQLWVAGEVAEKEMGKIAIGTKARIYLSAYPDKEFFGSISYIGPATVAKSASSSLSSHNETIPIKITIENGDGCLKPGLSAKVNLRVY